jgi:RNA polymerase sigma factor (sigma-70 family)
VAARHCRICAGVGSRRRCRYRALLARRLRRFRFEGDLGSWASPKRRDPEMSVTTESKTSAKLTSPTACGGIDGVMEDDTAELYRKHAADLLRLSTMLVGPGDADDVFTEAVLNATRARKWSDLDDDARGAYLYRTLINQARQWSRSKSRRQRRDAIWAARQRAETDDLSVPQSEVWEAVASLSQRQRAVVFLTYWEDLEGASIAERLGISVGTVRRYQVRAREQLRRKIDD